MTTLDFDPCASQLLGVLIDWRVSEIEHLGVRLELGSLAESDDVTALDPDVVVIATGGVPNVGEVGGSEHVTSSWDVLTGQAPVGGIVLIFDDHGQHQGASTAEYLVSHDVDLELITPDRAVMQELGNSNFAVHLEHLYAADVTFTPDHRLVVVAPHGNRLIAQLRNEYTGVVRERLVDHVVVEHGTLPVEDLYWNLRADSTNLGEVDIDAFAAGEALFPRHNPQGSYRLVRIGDAVASRNIHAAVFDALRMCKDL